MKSLLLRSLAVCLLMAATVFAQPAALPSKENFHLFLLIGQSNMAGRGTVEPQDKIAHPRVLTLNKDGAWVPAIDPIHFDKNIAGVGLGRTFGLELAESTPGATIGLIPCAVGGTPIDLWQPGALWDKPKCHPWDDAMVRAKLALKVGTLKGILWHQGESDSNREKAAAYASKLADLIARVRNELGAPTVPFIAGEPGQFAGRPWNEFQRLVDQTLRDLPAKVQHTAFASAEGLVDQGDKLHFDANSYREFGKRYAVAYLKLVGESSTAPAVFPTAGPVRVLFLGNSFTVRNKLPEVIQAMAAAGQPSRKLVPTIIAYGGRTMKDHWNLHSQTWVTLPALTEVELEQSIIELKQQSEKDPENGNIRRSLQRHEGLRATLKEARPKWDYVILQSWQDTAGGMTSGYVEYARRLATLARRNGAKVVFYDTAPETLNAAPLTEPPPRAPAEERARMLTTLAAEFDGLAVSVPLAVWHCQTQRPELTLRYTKDFHLNQTTAYLTAATFYAVLFAQSPEGLPVKEVTDTRVDDPAHPERNPDGGPQLKIFDDDVRLFLQRTAAKAVSDFRDLPPPRRTQPDVSSH